MDYATQPIRKDETSLKSYVSHVNFRETVVASKRIFTRWSPAILARSFLCTVLFLCTAALVPSCSEARGGIVQASDAEAANNPLGAKPQAVFESLANSGQTALISRSGYDYGASVIEDSGIRKYWWCANTLTIADVILYAEETIITGAFTTPVVVMQPNNSSSAWDRSFNCDPSVVRGQFVNPEDNSSYTYAMYYTATDTGPGSHFNPGSPGHPRDPQYGANNRIGVAFSNDGVRWVKYSSPVLTPQGNAAVSYGAGQPATYNSDGVDGIWLFYTDFSGPGGENVYFQTTKDGVTFNNRVALSTSGLLRGQPVRMGNIDIAFDYEGNIYATIPFAYPVQGQINSSPEGMRPGDSERYRFGLYRMPANNLTSGTWENLGYIDTDATGHHINHNAALVRDSFGNIPLGSSTIRMVFAGGDNDPQSWDLYSATWNIRLSRAPLKR
jgi:hypothetical protein